MPTTGRGDGCVSRGDAQPVEGSSGEHVVPTSSVLELTLSRLTITPAGRFCVPWDVWPDDVSNEPVDVARQMRRTAGFPGWPASVRGSGKPILPRSVELWVVSLLRRTATALLTVDGRSKMHPRWLAGDLPPLRGRVQQGPQQGSEANSRGPAKQFLSDGVVFLRPSVST